MSLAEYNAWHKATRPDLESEAFWQWHAACHEALKDGRLICWIYDLIPTFDSITGV